MITHVALVAVRVEISVVGQIDRARLINFRTIFNGDTVIVSQREMRERGEVTGESSSPSRESSENSTSRSFC